MLVLAMPCEITKLLNGETAKILKSKYQTWA